MTAADCPHGRPAGPDGSGAGCRHCQREQGRARRDRGLAATVDRPAGEWDLAVVMNAIKTLAATGREFSADDIRPLLPAVGSQVIGAAFSTAVKRKLIRLVGYRQSATASRRAGVVRVWVGTELAMRGSQHDHAQRDQPRRR